MFPPGVEPAVPSWKVGVVTALPPSRLLLPSRIFYSKVIPLFRKSMFFTR